MLGVYQVQVQLWLSGAVAPDVQTLFDVQVFQRRVFCEFAYQLVCDVMSAYDLVSVEEAAVMVVSGDEQGMQEIYRHVTR